MCYLDSSVVLRVLLGQQPQFEQWGAWQRAYSSRLMRCEVLRTLDRMRLAGSLDDEQIAACTVLFKDIASHLGQIPLTDAILSDVEASFATTTGTLDAIHIVSAKAYERANDPVVFVTHDRQQAVAARAAGLDVRGDHNG